MGRDSATTDRLRNLITKLQSLTASGELHWEKQAGSKSRVICICMAGMTTRFKIEEVTILDRLTIEIVGFICLPSPVWVCP